MPDASLFVAGDAAVRGDQGEKLLVASEAIALRLWDREPAGTEAQPHANPYEYVAFVLSGRMRLVIDNDSFEVGAGDSYRVPAASTYTLQVLESAQVVEATTPSDREIGPTDA